MMRKTDSKGFSVVEALIVIIVIGLLGGIGYYVYKQNKSSGSNVSDSTPKQITKVDKSEPILEVDDALLPKGWKVASKSKELVSLDNSDSQNATNKCFVEVSIVKDEKSKIVGETADERNTNTEKYADSLREARNASITEEKGYVFSNPDLMKNPDEVTFGGNEGEFNTSNGANSYPFYSGEVFKLTLPSDSQYVQYQHVGYIVRDGYYVQIVQSCNSGDLTEPSKALQAVLVDVDPLLSM